MRKSRRLIIDALEVFNLDESQTKAKGQAFSSITIPPIDPAIIRQIV